MIRIKTAPEYSSLSSFINDLPRTFGTCGNIIYKGRNLIKTFTLDDGTLLNVKRYHTPKGLNLLIYSLGIRKPKGLRAFHYPQILLSRGIETPAPVAYIEERKFGMLGYSYLVSIQCQYGHTMYDIGNAKEGTYEELAKAFARFTVDLHEKQIMHKDYSPGNILYTCMDDGTYKFSLVDINRMYFGHVDMKKGLANFKRLWGPKKFFTMMIREYARLRGFDESEAVDFALDARRSFWMKYRKRHDIHFKLEL